MLFLSEPSRTIRTLHLAGLLALGCAARGLADDDVPERTVTAPPAEEIDRLELSDFYKKFVSAGGIPIVSSEQVSDYALLEAAYLLDCMLVGREDIREAIAGNNVRFAIMSPTEMTTDIPEHSDLAPRSYWDKRARGLGATDIRPAVSCGEENLLCFVGDPYEGENILVHEFAHVIHQQGLSATDPTFDDRLEETFQQAMEDGLWEGMYAATNRHEYWAEGVQSYFDTNQRPDHTHNEVNTRAELIEYDPRLATLCREVFGENDWSYVAPEEREPASAHLEGYDPNSAPTFAWDPEVLRRWEEWEQAEAEAAQAASPEE